MSKSAVILCLNGRRKTAKFTPNTTIAQILEDVCTKENIDPSAYDLRTTKVVLDRTLPWRFTNLPNNAKLELCARNLENQSTSTAVKIGFQLSDGRRLTGEFPIDTLLSQIIQHFSNESKSLKEPDADVVPTIVYLRQKFVGNDVLCSTTLQKLGIIKGSALLRFLYEHPPPKAVNESKATKSAEKATFSKQESNHNFKKEPQRPAKTDSVNPISQSTSTTRLNPSVSTTLPSTTSVQSTNFSSIDIPMHDSDSVVEKQSKPSDLLDYFKSPPRQDDSSAGNKGPKISSVLSKRSKWHRPHTSANSNPPVSFLNFKFPEETKGADLLGAMTSSRDEVDLLTPCPRKAMLFNERRKTNDETASTDEPDEFFEVTLDDLRKMMSDLKQERKKLEEQDMLTEDQRKSKRLCLASKYPYVVIRIVLPERLVLQGIFRPLEKIRNLYKFVEEHLDVKSFYLFTTPPKKILKDKESTLFDNNLAPAARVYLGSNEDFPLNDQLIKESSADLVCSIEEANRYLASLKS